VTTVGPAPRKRLTPTLAGAGPLVGVAALAAALRWFRIDTQSLWYDEGISVHQLTRSLPDIVRAAALDTHPPLYYATLKAWGELFGSSELALRSLSAAWGLLAVVLTWLIGRRLFGTVAGTVAALLLAVAPLAVYYSQEVRMYAQVTGLGLLAVCAYVLRNNQLYAVAGLATLYSQYLGVATLFALNLHALLWWHTRTRREWLAWLAANAGVALGFLPWLPNFIAQQSHALNTSPRTPDGLALDTLTAYGGGIARSDIFLGAGAVLAAVALIGWAGSGLGHTGRSESRNPEYATLALLVWLMPLGLVLGLGLHSGLFELRYLVLSLPGLMLLAGFGIVHLVKHPALAIAVAFIAMVPAGLALLRQYYEPALARDDYRGLVAAIERQARPTDVVLLSAPNQVEIFDYYYHGPLATIGLPAQRPMDPEDTLQRLDALHAQYDRVWLVSWAMGEADPQGVISTWLAENGFQATHQWYGSVQLALVGFGPSNASTEHTNIPLDNGIVLEGYRLASRSLKRGETLALTLLWRADRGPTSDRWKVFTHLLDASSIVVAQRDAEPADNLRPTTSWEPGERIEDNYGIVVPADLPAGSYTLEIGMYDGQTRSVFDGQGDHLMLGQVQIQP
jgi:mannosyltransferase